MVDQVSSIRKALDSIPSTTKKLERTEEVLATTAGSTIKYLKALELNLRNYLGATTARAVLKSVSETPEEGWTG